MNGDNLEDKAKLEGQNIQTPSPETTPPSSVDTTEASSSRTEPQDDSVKFKSSDIGIKTVVKNTDFAKVTEKKVSLFVKISTFFAAFLKNIQNFFTKLATSIRSVFSSKRGRISVAVFCTVLLVAGAGIVVIYQNYLKNHKPKEVDISNPNTNISELITRGGEDFSSPILQSAKTKIESLHRQGKHTDALNLARDVSKKLEDEDLPKEALEVLKYLDLTKFPENKEKFILLQKMMSLAYVAGDETASNLYYEMSEAMPESVRNGIGG